MSDIKGDGYGSSHDWLRVQQVGRCTIYLCRNCGVIFPHHYPRLPSIHQAMHSEGIPDICNKNAQELSMDESRQTEKGG